MDLRKANKESPDLSIAVFAKIQEIFSRKKWPISEPFDEDYFDNFCKMLAGLNQEQCELILTLTDKFLWIQENDYMSRFADSFNLFISSFNFIRGKNIYLCPALSEDDFGKSKGSVDLLYKLTVHLKAIQHKYSDFQITYADSPVTVDYDLIKANYTLCLIDDFIGTGETIENALMFFRDKGITNDMIVIVSLVGMKTGITKLNDIGYNTYVKITLDKGLTSTKDDSKIKVMHTIEESIGVKDDFRFGYKGSEALVRMMKTPNNTFPIYWLRNKKNEYAPFPR